MYLSYMSDSQSASSVLKLIQTADLLNAGLNQKDKINCKYHIITV